MKLNITGQMISYEFMPRDFLDGHSIPPEGEPALWMPIDKQMTPVKCFFVNGEWISETCHQRP